MVEVRKCKVYGVCWVCKAFPAKLPQNLCCEIGCIGNWHCHADGLLSLKLAKAIHPHDFLQGSWCSSLHSEFQHGAE
jgi:hypothetical protein